MKKTHIPNGVRTYCGKLAHLVECIDLKTTAIDEATCLTCQRSDDRRQIETWRRELFQEGWRDFYSPRKCPYAPDSEEEKFWTRGFKFAEQKR